jgi:exosome complex RNA-binding protein Rrp42 (RNase PH superfamily)
MELSLSEQNMLISCLTNKIRFDGRNLTERRKFVLEHSERLQTNSFYGCRIQNPETKNWIYFSVTGNLTSCENESNLDHLISVNLDSPLSVEQDQKAKYKEIKNYSEKKELESLIDSFFLKKIDKSCLFLGKFKCYWNIKLHVFSLGVLHLNDLDYIIYGLTHTLMEMTVPNVSIGFNNLNDQYTFEMLSGQNSLFQKKDIPIIFLLGEIDGNVILDMTFKELMIVSSFYVSSFDSNGNLLEMQKIDGKPTTISKINSILNTVRKLVINE